jgi:hypothetical protein
LCGKSWAVTDEEKQAVAARGCGWGNANGAVRIVRAADTQANPVMNGGWVKGGWEAPVGNTTWMDGVTTQYDEKEITDWVDPTPPKTEQELTKERVDKALVGWPWKGIPSNLVSIVRT